jgi:hypothetical protein
MCRRMLLACIAVIALAVASCSAASGQLAVRSTSTGPVLTGLFRRDDQLSQLTVQLLMQLQSEQRAGERQQMQAQLQAAQLELATVRLQLAIRLQQSPPPATERVVYLQPAAVPQVALPPAGYPQVQYPPAGPPQVYLPPSGPPQVQLPPAGRPPVTLPPSGSGGGLPILPPAGLGIDVAAPEIDPSRIAYWRYCPPPSAPALPCRK